MTLSLGILTWIYLEKVYCLKKGLGLSNLEEERGLESSFNQSTPDLDFLFCKTDGWRDGVLG